MMRARTSILTLLGYVGLIAVGLAALRVSSRLWATVGFSFCLLTLVGSLALLFHRRESGRSYWAGFALFGWSYFLIAVGPTSLSSWREQLVTTPILAILEDQLLGEPATQLAQLRPRRGGPIAPQVELSPWSHWTSTDRSNPFASDSFQRIGHSLFCLGIAMGGGAFCRTLRDSLSDASPLP
ncbi:hypothetical protein P12x_001503 [Tundrisphaera lichenicola]|uniref:hypothetical protein n=1 Tax=Tundrisphaera lichenicola TaxID=2029860 RepID=UPI003EBDE8EA